MSLNFSPPLWCWIPKMCCLKEYGVYYTNFTVSYLNFTIQRQLVFVLAFTETYFCNHRGLTLCRKKTARLCQIQTGKGFGILSVFSTERSCLLIFAVNEYQMKKGGNVQVWSFGWVNLIFPEKEVDVCRHTFNSSAAQTTVRLTSRPLRINICIGKHKSLAMGFN